MQGAVSFAGRAGRQAGALPKVRGVVRRAAVVGLEDIPVRNIWCGASDEPCLFIRNAPSLDPAVLRLRI